MNPVPTYYYSNRMGRIILESMQEVVGKNGFLAVLQLAGLSRLAEARPDSDGTREYSFEVIATLLEKMEQMYGPRGGRGLALRAGRSCFKYGLREFGTEMGLTEAAFRLLPLPVKLRTAGKALADLFNKYTDQSVRFEEVDGKFFWHIDRCPMCWGRHSDDAICHLAVGVLQESLYWLSGGKIFNVEETHCMARGDSTCTIEINSVPFE